jgi:uncharacterized protein YjbI with pentapeptide repeats
VIAAELLERILAAVPRNEHARPTLTRADFERTVFEHAASFERTTFEGAATFHRATFKGAALFVEANFTDSVRFAEATFERRASFIWATFKRNVWFNKATFENEVDFGNWVGDTATFNGSAGFDDTIFKGEASFHQVTFDAVGFHHATFEDTADFFDATFGDGARFVSATFGGFASFNGATFKGGAWFNGATFKDEVVFNGATFKREADFSGATFDKAQQLGPILVRKQLDLDGAVFNQRVRVQAATALVCARRARFPAGMQLQLRQAQILLDDADLAAPSILAGVPPFPSLDEARFAVRWARLPNSLLRDRPSLLSARRADVAGLTLANIDLRACRFAGAHHLDQLRVEGEPHFAPTPRGWRWTKRQTLAEEHHWRNSHGASAWYPPACQLPPWAVEELSPPHPIEVAALYRALRKGREGDKDQPGAADFYYGEMEMRRRARALDAGHAWRQRELGRWTSSATDLAILTFYWLVSGYALRAWRALAALLVVIMLAGIGFAFWGFAALDEPTIRPVRVDARGTPIYAEQPMTRPAGLDELSHAIWFSAESATALLRSPDRALTLPGRALQLALRLLGPVLLGLAVLSIRGRVKR